MLSAAGEKIDTASPPFCDACFSGHYPVKFPRLKDDAQLGLF
jgi:amidophosphoribosyltransferase